MSFFGNFKKNNEEDWTLPSFPKQKIEMVKIMSDPNTGSPGEFRDVVQPFNPDSIKENLWVVMDPKASWEVELRNANKMWDMHKKPNNAVFAVLPSQEAAVTYAQTLNRYMLVMQLSALHEIIPQLPKVQDITRS